MAGNSEFVARKGLIVYGVQVRVALQEHLVLQVQTVRQEQVEVQEQLEQVLIIKENRPLQ